jgi:hypothetical protein
MATIKLRYTVEDVDRHGNVRIYFRRRGRRKSASPVCRELNNSWTHMNAR